MATRSSAAYHLRVQRSVHIQNEAFAGVAGTLSPAIQASLDVPKVGKHCSFNQMLLIQGKIVLNCEAAGGDATWAHVSMMSSSHFSGPRFC